MDDPVTEEWLAQAYVWDCVDEWGFERNLPGGAVLYVRPHGMMFVADPTEKGLVMLGQCLHKDHFKSLMSNLCCMKGSDV